MRVRCVSVRVCEGEGEVCECEGEGECVRVTGDGECEGV